MAIKGNLQTLEISNVLQLLCSDQKTGILTLTNDNNEVKVNILEGSIIFATSSQEKFRIGILLRNDGIISEDRLKNCLKKSKQINNAVGKVLVDEGLISQNVLDIYITRQVENILYDIFFWREGNFEYKDMELDLKRIKTVPLNIMNLLLEASRRIDEMSVLEKQIPNANMVYQITKNIQELGDIILNINEWRILSFINGKQSVKQIVKISGFDKFSAYKILYSLFSYGLLREVVTTNSENKFDYSIIVAAFYNILQIIHSELEDGTD